MPVRPMLLHRPSFCSTVLLKFEQLAKIFWANGLPPLVAKNRPYAYDSCTGLKRLKFSRLFDVCARFPF